jgi:hypothetical protein
VTAGRIAAMAALLAALVLGAVVVAVFGWRAMGPPVHAPIAGMPAEPLPTILASGLWSGAAPVPATDGRVEVLSRAGGDVRLLGVLAERDGGGYALFRLPEGPRLVAAGQDVSSGLRLVAVRPDGVTLRDSGSERAMVLRPDVRPKNAPTGATPAVGGTVVPPIRTATTRNPACVAPQGFKGSVLRLNAELFQGIVAKPESWAAMLAAERGALVVRDDSGFIAMLAMKKQDRLEQANGIALGSPEDIVGAVLRPLAANQQVRITGTRDGAPREWLLLNAGACPA